MQKIQIPNRWTPRDYQMPLWEALEGGCKRALYTWHRRAGKDDIGLHFTATEALERPGVYWYMLPEAAQARKAIWKAIDPHTGLRRIDWAFPPEMRASANDTEMFINFKTGSTWQVVGSDNYNSLVGAPPRGVVFSEWALANPAAWAYIRPILKENGGWALFNFTPRGRNHAVRMYEGAKGDPDWFVQKLTAEQTDVFTKAELEKERLEYIRDFGEDDGEARFLQEYYCDFNSPLIGAFYAKQLSDLENKDRIGTVDYQPNHRVHTYWDLGWSDDTTIWFVQTVGQEVHVIDCYEAHGQDVSHYAKVLQSRGYVYGDHWLPHDARAKTLASGGKSIVEQLFSLGIKGKIVPDLSLQDGIQAVRAILPRCWFDATRCRAGLEALRQYQREWDDDAKVFKRTPLHNWASHYADAFRYFAVAYKSDHPTLNTGTSFRNPTMNELWDRTSFVRETRI